MLCLNICLSVCLSIYLSACLSVNLSIDRSIYLSIYLPIYICMYVYTYTSKQFSFLFCIHTYECLFFFPSTSTAYTHAEYFFYFFYFFYFYRHSPFRLSPSMSTVGCWGRNSRMAPMLSRRMLLRYV